MKKKALLTLTVLMLGLFCLTSCQSKEERAINKLEQLSERIEKNGDKYDMEEWSGIMKELEAINDDIDDCKFTSEQLEEVGRLQAKFYKVIMKNGSSLFSGALSSFGSYAKGFKEGLMDGDFDENDLKEQFGDLENAFKEAMESFEDGIKEFDEELDNVSDELDELDEVEEDFPEELDDLDD
ncbi:MAG: hypothetical protein IKW91_00495 [Bacteroidaceae bacterium]|nr:hypothetical protein [Bacteroidaceae bacterium]